MPTSISGTFYLLLGILDFVGDRKAGEPPKIAISIKDYSWNFD
jgi:hypothetical protein